MGKIKGKAVRTSLSRRKTIEKLKKLSAGASKGPLIPVVDLAKQIVGLDEFLEWRANTIRELTTQCNNLISGTVKLWSDAIFWFIDFNKDGVIDYDDLVK